MYRILIVEDEPAAADALKHHVMRYGTEHGEAFEIAWHKTAERLMGREHPFDLIFLDIELPGIDGMEAATLLRSYDSATPIIFVTNLANYAVRGYEVDALDFIVKPVGYYNFSMRMDKAMRTLRRNSGRSIVVPSRGGTQVFPQADLVYVEVVNHDLVYHVAGGPDSDGGFPRVRGSLKKLEDDLADGPFLRISSSCLVNMNHVRLAQPGTLRMSTGETLYVSRANKRRVLETIADYLGGSI